MKRDEFETRLSRVPPGGPPPEWREEILAAARRAVVSEPSRETRVTGQAWCRAEGIRSRWAWFRAWWEAERTPWHVIAAACVVLLGLRGLDGWLESRPATEARRVVRTSGAGEALAAVRTHRAEILAWLDRDEAGASVEGGGAVVPSRDADKPRGDWRPGASPRSWNPGMEEREA